MCGLKIPRKLGRRGRAVRRGQPGTVCIHEELFELRAQRAHGRRVRPAGQRRRPPTRFAIRLVERGERRPLDDHRRVEAADQALELVEREKKPVARSTRP